MRGLRRPARGLWPVALTVLTALAASWSTPSRGADGGPTSAPPQAVAALGEAAIAALRRGDLDEVTRQMQRAGRAAMVAALDAPGPAAVAAAWAMSEAATPWPLPYLATAAHRADRRRATAATAAARAVAARLQPEAAAAEDLDGEALVRWRARWLDAARSPRWIDVRVDALVVAARLAQVAAAMGATAPPLPVELLRDADPALRRAAVELLEAPLSPATRAALVAALPVEPEPEVARAVAAALCFDAELEPARALGAEGLARVQALAQGARALRAADLELARCLRNDGSVESARALRQLRGLAAAAPAPLRAAWDSAARQAR